MILSGKIDSGVYGNWTGGSDKYKDVWFEICGDGLDFNKNEWDDGNTKNGDGWSSTWEIEKWWECKGGTIHSPDAWNLLYITANLTRSSIPNTYDINFSTEMNKTDITLNDLLVTVSSKYNIKYTWNATYINDKTLRVSIVTSNVLIGDEIVTIKFISYKIFRGPYGGWLSIDSVTSIANNNLINSEQTASSMSVFFQFTTYTGILVTIVLIILGGGSLEMLWALLSSMQLTLNPLCNLSKIIQIYEN